MCELCDRIEKVERLVLAAQSMFDASMSQFHACQQTGTVEEQSDAHDEVMTRQGILLDQIAALYRLQFQAKGPTPIGGTSSMREVIFDTETTGLEAGTHKLVEFAAVEMIDKVVTGRTLHVYINPGRLNDPEALRVHGLTDAFLRKQKPFDHVSGRILDFLGKDRIVAHNAEFDMNFLQAELEEAELPRLQNEVVDTLALARTVKRGGKHTLDVLCSHFKVDRSKRAKHHGALIDAQILAEVYIHLCGGRQIGFDLIGGGEKPKIIEERSWPRRCFPPPPQDEVDAHMAFIATMPNAIWNSYHNPTEDVALRSLSV